MDAPDPKRWHTREDSGIKLDRELRWWHDGERIDHPKIIETFNRGVVPAEDGKFKLEVGRDWCFIEVEDAAYGVLAIDAEPDGFRLWLSDRTEEQLDPATLALGEDGVVTCAVKQGRARARFSRDAQFQLGEHLEEVDGSTCLRVAGERVPVSL